ncbi:cytochrome c oxidase subunit 3 [Chelativorans sp. AA-79]|uniref:cytochrome c oxidase subunit 3 n=1 Tax=Chelativorans sp. AA-79 TaxID=3028735 RepID=UPI0023F78EC2|nr:cytochrome c oxidase subunit 3 [Chelativorans sp. AA-79]WEX11995.1 cytochrome c oxidase subunit 3 [Chelativorans sp. AA-79]
MMWVLIFSELVAFGVMLVAFSVARAALPALFAAGQATLDPFVGGFNTVVLVTSGWLAAWAVRARVDGRGSTSSFALVGAIFFGLVFVAVKLFEYAAKVEAGIGLETDTFFTLYFLITGFHLLHVLLGIVILGVVAFSGTVEALRTGAAFWHMVDLVWVVMYPLIYLVG